MRKGILIGLVLFLVPLIMGASSVNYLTKGRADTLYCAIGGNCNLSSLNVDNITVFNYSQILDEGWVNESGDTMTGDLIMSSSSIYIDDNEGVFYGDNNECKVDYSGANNLQMLCTDQGATSNILVGSSEGVYNSGRDGGFVSVFANHGASSASNPTGDGGLLFLTGGDGGSDDDSNNQGGDGGDIILRGGILGTGSTDGNDGIVGVGSNPITPVYIGIDEDNFIVEGDTEVQGDTHIIGQTNTSDVYVNKSLYLQKTTSSTEGVVYMNGTKILHSLGEDNLFIGDSGNFFFDTLAECNSQTYFGTALTAIGKFALDNVRCGFSNFALGESALTNCNNCSQNVAIGADTLKQTTTGNSNVAIGQSALAQQTTTSNNIAIGRNAGFWITSTQNTIMGSFAGDSISTGQQNTLIGYNIISSGSTYDADRNTIMGANAGYAVQGDNNVIIGYSAGIDETGSDNLIIDTWDRGSLQAGRDEAIIYGLMSSAHEDQELEFHAQVDVGTTATPEDLNVTGNITGKLIYAEGWGHDLGDIPLASSNVYFNITNMTYGENNGIPFDGDNFTLTFGGVYKISTSWSFSGTANNEYHISMLVNGVQQDKCHAERVIGTGADVGSAGFTCLYSFSSNDIAQFAIENLDSAGNPTIHDINVNFIRIGGS